MSLVKSHGLNLIFFQSRIPGIEKIKGISFAQKNISGVTFMEGDATRLPFADNMFDVTISNTVQEHVEPIAFWDVWRSLKKKKNSGTSRELFETAIE